MGCLVALICLPLFVLASPVVLIRAAFGPESYWASLDRQYGALGAFVLRFFSK